MDLRTDYFIISQENEKQDLVTGSSIVFILTSSSSCFLFTPNVCKKIKFKISGTFQNGKEQVKPRDDLCGLSQDQKIFRIGFDLLYPGQYKVIVKFSNNHVANSPFKFQVSSEVEMKDFKKVFTEMDKHDVMSVLVKQVEDQLRKAQDRTCSGGCASHGYPSPCKNGCGFFSSVDSQGFSSLCYKDLQKKQTKDTHDVVTNTTNTFADLNISFKDNEAIKEDSNPTAAVVVKPVTDASSQNVEVDEKNEDQKKESKKPKKNRCGVCRKKVGLTGFSCRCEGLYCSLHRYSDCHHCRYDYLSLGRREVASNNPLVTADKVTKL